MNAQKRPVVFGRRVKTRYGVFDLRATERGLFSLQLPPLPIPLPPQGGEGKGEGGIHRLLKQTAACLRAYLAGKPADFRSLPIDWSGLNSFEKHVLQELRKIPRGKTASYQALAVRTGRSRNSRQVGRILHLNRLPIVLPCHRIVPKSGGWGGFSSGIRWKKRLLKLEGGSVDKRLDV